MVILHSLYVCESSDEVMVKEIFCSKQENNFQMVHFCVIEHYLTSSSFLDVSDISTTTDISCLPYPRPNYIYYEDLLSIVG